MGVKHKFTSLKADDADTTLVRPSDWNADHQLVASSTDNAIPRFDGTGGDALQNSGVTIDDSDNLTVPGTLTADGVVLDQAGGTGTQNLRLGPDTLISLTTGSGNIAIGDKAGRLLSSGNSNTAVGREALSKATTGFNTCYGTFAGREITTGLGNVLIGGAAGDALTTGSYCTAVGLAALSAATTGNLYCTAVGYAACEKTNALYNNAIGGFALRQNVSGIGNNAMGFGALENCTNSSNNAVGRSALQFLTSGSANTAIGTFSGIDTTTGSRNVYIGESSGANVTTGSDNVMLGNNAGEKQADGTTDLTDPELSVYIGRNARGLDNSDNNSVVIGGNTPIGKGANTTVIGTTATTEFWAYGTHRLDAENIETDTTTGTKIGTGTSQKLGFWNATPIVQPTTGIAEAAFVENAGGTAVNDDSTFDGYTLRQVVKALRDMGILA